jgi:hypothetical protein
MTKNKRKVIKHTILAAAMCLVMGMGIVSFADDKGTVIPASAKIRASADASSTQVGSVAQGGNVDIIGKTTGSDGNTWYQVYVDANTKGYIRADLIKVAGTGTIPEITSDTSTTTTTASTTDQSVTEATAVDAKTCTVSQNSVRIRKGASTNHDIVATANKGMTLTITGEANGSDGKLWYQVSFTYNNKEVTGFIRSDLVTFDNVSSDAAVSEIQGESGEEANVEQETVEDNQEASESSESSSQGIVLMNVDETPYILPGFSAVSLSWNDESIQAYSNGGFYLFYAQMANGDEGWYMFDSEKGEYQRYVYTASATATVPKSSESVGIIPVIVMIIIIIILVVVIGILLIKLRESAYSYEYEDDEQEEDDVEDLEFEEIQPRRQTTQGQAQRRQGQMPQGQRQQTTQGQVQRRQGQMPQGQGQQAAQGQAQRRQVSSQGQQTAQGQQAQRRQVSSQGQQAAQGQTQRRQGQMSQQVSSQGQQTAQGQVQRRQGQMPQGQQVQGRANSNVQRQRTTANPDSTQGYKAKTILDNNDDMDFIDV